MRLLSKRAFAVSGWFQFLFFAMRAAFPAEPVTHGPMKLGQSVFSGALFSPRGDTLFTTGKHITRWDLTTGQEMRRFVGHREQIHVLALSDDGGTLASGSGLEFDMGFIPKDVTERVWDVGSGKEVQCLRGHGAFAHTVFFGRGGDQLLTAGRDARAIRWDIAAAKQLWVLDHLPSGPPALLVDSADDRLLAFTGARREMRICDAKTGAVRHLLKNDKTSFASASFNPAGTRIVTGCNDGTVVSWDVDSGKVVCAFAGHSSDVPSVQFSADGAHVLSASSDATATIWDMNTAGMLKKFAHAGPLRGASLSNDSRRVLARWSLPRAKVPRTGPPRDVYVPLDYASLWDAGTGREIRRVLLDPRAGAPLAIFSPDGKWVFTNSEKPMLWDAETGELIRRYD